jgi:hypothetical protein
MASGGEFGGGGAQVRRGNPAIRRRLWAIPVDSLGGEEEGGDSDLLSTSEEQGAASNGGAKRRAPATVRFHRERGRVTTGKRGRTAREREREEGGGVASLGSPGILLGLQSEQEVAREAQRASTQLLDWLKVEDKGRFAKRLSRFGVF